jgi:hypothetical protein
MTAAYVKNIGQRSRRDISRKLIVQVSLPQGFGVCTPRLSVK